MKKLILLILLIAGGIIYFKFNAIVGYFSMSKTKQTTSNTAIESRNAVSGKKILIAFFSWGGNTRKVARYIHDNIGGDLYEITTIDPNHYPKDYKATVAVGKNEVEKKIFPQINAFPGNMDSYEILLIGYPIWWHESPMSVQGFLQQFNLKGKIILPFATSGGDDITLTMESVKMSAANAIIKDGLTANLTRNIRPWLLQNKLF